MDAREPSLAGKLDDARTRRRVVRHRNGRLWLTAIFLVLRPADFFLLKYAHAAGEERLIAATLVLFLWTSGLLAAIWVRFSWARYVLIVVLLIVSVLTTLTGLSAAQWALPIRLALITSAPLYICAVALLANSAAIKDLVSRAKD